MGHLKELLDPTTGVLRGIMVNVEPGKGGPDPDDKIIGIKVGELKKIHTQLTNYQKLTINLRTRAKLWFEDSRPDQVGLWDTETDSLMKALLGDNQ